MRCIGIIGAMEVEVASLKEQMKDIQVTRKASMEFYSGIIEGKNVVVVRSGIGKVNAAVCTQILIDDFKAEVVINTGIAGSLNADINIGAEQKPQRHLEGTRPVTAAVQRTAAGALTCGSQ